MIEKIKSILLLFLVVLSLLLTYQLWYGQKPAQLIAEEVFERIIVEKPRPLEEVVTPLEIVVTIEEGYYIFRNGDPHYNQLWNITSKLLQEANKPSDTINDMLAEDALNLLTYHLKPELPLGAGAPWLSESASAMVSEINLYSLEENLWLELSGPADGTVLYVQLTPENVEIFNSLLVDITTENQMIYTILSDDLLSAVLEYELNISAPIYVPLDTVKMNRVILKPEEIDRDLILKTFFVDHNLARIIEEKDGGLIYTDGNRGLRLTDTGFEYSSPGLEEGQVTLSYTEAMISSSSLISYHGGWHEGLRFEDLYLDGWGRAKYYSAEWGFYHNGYPFFTSHGTRTLFNDRGLIHCARSIYIPVDTIQENGEQLSAALWQEALEAALKILLARLFENEQGLFIEKMNLGYAVIGSANIYKGEPVWFIQINGEKIFLKAESLEPLNKEDLL
ncbi:MAG: two-component system activity regulator YycH [Bacillota bacterium]